MGILGDIQLTRRTKTVTLGLSTTGKKIEAVVSAPPLQLASELQRQIPAPEPPAMRDSAGKVQFRTHPKTGKAIRENGQLVPMLNRLDDDYLQTLSSVTRARTIAMIFECTKFPGASSVARGNLTPIEFQLARWKELEDLGCTIGVYSELSDACVDLSQPMTTDEIVDARTLLGADEKTQKEVKAKLGSKAPKGK